MTLDSRQAKEHSAPSRESLLARWEAQSIAAETQALSAVPDEILGRAFEAGPAGRQPFGMEIERVIAAGAADAQRRKATFSRYELTRMLNRHLSDHLGGLPGDQGTRLLDDLTGQALRRGGPAEAIRLTAPEMAPVPEVSRRADGLSVWRKPRTGC